MQFNTCQAAVLGGMFSSVTLLNMTLGSDRLRTAPPTNPAAPLFDVLGTSEIFVLLDRSPLMFLSRNVRTDFTDISMLD